MTCCRPFDSLSRRPTMKQYARCLSNDFGDKFAENDVLPCLVYETLGIVDESGEDYLYPSKHFLSLTDVQSVQLDGACWRRRLACPYTCDVLGPFLEEYV